jgi:hypothetical protein
MTRQKLFKILLPVFLILLVAILASVGLSALSKKKSVSMEYNHALVIGINNYQDWSKLTSPVKDAEAMAKILLDKYDFKKENISLLTDNTKEKPTEATILDYLDNYAKKLTEKDNLLIFFSGHSTEDDDGETYWIPKDGRKRKRYWLSHTELAETYFTAKDFKVKSLLILTDSPVTTKLIKTVSITLSPFDLRYPEKIKEKASRKSREIIAFGDAHWPGTKDTEGLGLFTYYLRKALDDNFLKTIDFENLMFDENIIFPISKIAGTKLQRGRIRTPMEKGGQFIITKLTPARIIDVVDAFANPPKGYPEDRFTIEALTSSSAGEVYIEIEGKKRLMRGEGKKWKYSLKQAKGGVTAFQVTAINEDNLAGKGQQGQFTVLKEAGVIANVVTAQVIPKKGKEGEEFSFRALTDKPANKVAIRIRGKQFEMEGSGTRWYLNKEIKEAGAVAFSILATNDDGVLGAIKRGSIRVEGSPVNVVQVIPAPKTGFSGDEFTITVMTDRPATDVALKMDGTEYAMQGSGNTWRYSKTISDVGSKQFTVIAKNFDGKSGRSKSGMILTKERPAGIPDVTVVAVNPKKVYQGETFSINVKTSLPSKDVYVEIDGELRAMEGSGTQWNYMAQVDQIGTKKFKAIAKNKDGKQGKTKGGSILIAKRPAKSIDVLAAEISPSQGLQGDAFTFKATTSGAARSVALVIGEKSYKMTGSGTNWSLKQRIEDAGTLSYSVVAKNQDGVPGSSKVGNVLINAQLVNVTEISSPKTGFAGEDFSISAKTNLPAKTVSLKMGETVYAMEGSGKTWRLKRKIPDIGKKQFTVIAKNADGKDGLSKSGEILTKKRPMAVPDIATLDVSVVSPGKGFTGDSFEIKAKTSVPSDVTYVEIDGKQHAMEGSGTEWSYIVKIDKVGANKYSVIAKNKDGVQGKPREGEIVATRRAALLTNVVKAKVSPEKAETGKLFTFTATTDGPAKGVTLVLGNRRYKMAGSDKQWRFRMKLNKIGTQNFSVIPVNKEGMEGGRRTASVTVEKIRQRYKASPNGKVRDVITGQIKDRFTDNGDGTVSDLLLSLMWLQKPKQIALSYGEAVEYCRSLQSGGHSGWRLPTIAELNRVVDKKQQNPALPLNHPFSGILTHVGFWSKSKHKFGPQYVYQMNMWMGQSAHLKKKDNGIAWPVRFAGEPKG